MPWSQGVFTEEKILSPWSVWVIAIENKISQTWICVLKMFESMEDSDCWVMQREFPTSKDCLIWLETEMGRIFN